MTDSPAARCAPEIDKLITWRKVAVVPPQGTASSVTVAGSQSPNHLKLHAKFPKGFSGSKDLTLDMAAWQGGPPVRISLTRGLLQVG